MEIDYNKIKESYKRVPSNSRCSIKESQYFQIIKKEHNLDSREDIKLFLSNIENLKEIILSENIDIINMLLGEFFIKFISTASSADQLKKIELQIEEKNKVIREGIRVKERYNELEKIICTFENLSFYDMYVINRYNGFMERHKYNYLIKILKLVRGSYDFNNNNHYEEFRELFNSHRPLMEHLDNKVYLIREGINNYSQSDKISLVKLKKCIPRNIDIKVIDKFSELP